MNKANLLLSGLFLILLAACGEQQSPDVVSVQESDDPTAPVFGKVMIIGMDGTRSEGIQQANTPNIDAIVADGYADFDAITGDISFSGPGWASMLTGVWCAKHDVIDNDASWAQSKFDQYPHLITRLEEVRPEAVTVSISHWDPINDEILCADERDDNCGGADQITNVGTDIEVRDKVIEALETRDELDVVFMQFDDIDHAGHGNTTDGGSDPGGFCPFNNLALGETDGVCQAFQFNQNYINTIELTDGYIGEIMTALEARPNYADENWLILMSPDHGGGAFIFNQHGSPQENDRRTFFIVRGDAAAPLPDKQIKIVDIAVTALEHLGVTIDESWGLDGQAVGLIGAAEYQDSTIPSCFTGAVDDGR